MNYYCRKRLGLYLICLANIFSVQSQSKIDMEQTKISVTDFGAIPDDNRDDTSALRHAAEYCRKHPGTTLVMPAGIYRLRDSKAEKLEKEVLEGKMGANPERVIFTPYYPYVQGLNFDGSESVVIEAMGAIIMCEGWMEPLSIVNCRNFVVNGLTIDYKHKPFSQGIVHSIDKESFVVRFDSRREITNEMPITRMILWDKDISGVYATPFYFPKRKLLGDNLVEFKGKLSERMLGASLAALHSFHFRPAIFIENSKSVLLKRVTIHSQPGMGIVGFDSSDITMNGLSVTPADGYMFSTNTDATHFAGCEGLISFDGCFFHGQGDDATNVHGYYHNITALEGDVATLELTAPTFTHAQITDVPRVGDKMELVRVSTLVPERVLEVVEVEHEPKAIDVKVRLKGELPQNIKEFYLFNITKLPRLEFRRSIVWGQLARGVLAKTRSVKIEDNIFRGCTGTAIHVGAESGWKEGTHSEDVIIANNMIIDCGLGSGCQYGASGIAVVIDAPDTQSTVLHDKVCIINNTIIGVKENECGISVRNARNVKLMNNHIEGCKENVMLHSVKNIIVE